jgi:cell division septation protein DedD
LFNNSVADDDSAAVLYKNENDYGAIANPGFSSMPTFNPYAMMYQQRQQPMFYNGWFYSFGHPSPMSPPSDRDPNNRQFEAEDEEYFDNEQTVRQSGPFHIAPAVTTTTPRPAITTTTKPAAATPTTTPAATTTPVPSKVQCGRGPTTFPKSLHWRKGLGAGGFFSCDYSQKEFLAVHGKFIKNIT